MYRWHLPTGMEDLGGVFTPLGWTVDPKRPEKEVNFVAKLSSQRDIEPLAPVLSKGINRCLLEVETRKGYLKAVQKRYRQLEKILGNGIDS